MSQDPVFYSKDGFEIEIDGTKSTPGWYFYAEDWCTTYGPYEDEQTARKQLESYVAYLNRSKV